jgi:hypothetical protein
MQEYNQSSATYVILWPTSEELGWCVTRYQYQQRWFFSLIEDYGFDAHIFAKPNVPEGHLGGILWSTRYCTSACTWAIIFLGMLWLPTTQDLGYIWSRMTFLFNDGQEDKEGGQLYPMCIGPEVGRLCTTTENLVKKQRPRGTWQGILNGKHHTADCYTPRQEQSVLNTPKEQ